MQSSGAMPQAHGVVGQSGRVSGCNYSGSQLDSYMQDASIAVKEMLPIVLSCFTWRHAWWGCTVRCVCDNEAVVRVVNSWYARDPLLAHMLRSMFL